MATRAQGRSSPSSPAAGEDAIASLMADHKRVKALFKEFEDLKENGEDDDKAELVRQICGELTVHSTIEEEIFYPAVREKVDEDDMMDEALVEHTGAKDLIAQLEGMKPGDELYDAKVTVLGEQIEHHVKEEEGEMFPQAKRAKVDTAALGREMAERRVELMTALGLAAVDAEGETEVDEDTSADTPKRKSAGRR